MSTIRETGIHPDLDRDSDSICIENKILTDKHIYFEGSIGEIEGYDFWCREAFLDSDNGIGGGRLDQLVLKHNDEIVARFNHGWDIPPETTEHARAIDAICDRMVSPRPDWDNDPALEFEASIAEDIDMEQELELVDDVEPEPVFNFEPDHHEEEQVSGLHEKALLDGESGEAEKRGDHPSNSPAGNDVPNDCGDHEVDRYRAVVRRADKQAEVKACQHNDR